MDLPGTPKVRLISKGLSIEITLPNSLIIALPGKALRELVELGPIKDVIIKGARRHADKFLHIDI